MLLLVVRVLPTTAQVAVLRFGERESRAPSLDASGLPVEVTGARARPLEFLR